MANTSPDNDSEGLVFSKSYEEFLHSFFEFLHGYNHAREQNLIDDETQFPNIETQIDSVLDGPRFLLYNNFLNQCPDERSENIFGLILAILNELANPMIPHLAVLIDNPKILNFIYFEPLFPILIFIIRQNIENNPSFFSNSRFIDNLAMCCFPDDPEESLASGWPMSIQKMSSLVEGDISSSFLFYHLVHLLALLCGFNSVHKHSFFVWFVNTLFISTDFSQNLNLEETIACTKIFMTYQIHHRNPAESLFPQHLQPFLLFSSNVINNIQSMIEQEPMNLQLLYLWNSLCSLLLENSPESIIEISHGNLQFIFVLCIQGLKYFRNDMTLRNIDLLLKMLISPPIFSYSLELFKAEDYSLAQLYQQIWNSLFNFQFMYQACIEENLENPFLKLIPPWKAKQISLPEGQNQEEEQNQEDGQNQEEEDPITKRKTEFISNLSVINYDYTMSTIFENGITFCQQICNIPVDLYLDMGNTILSGFLAFLPYFPQFHYLFHPFLENFPTAFFGAITNCTLTNRLPESNFTLFIYLIHDPSYCNPRHQTFQHFIELNTQIFSNCLEVPALAIFWILSFADALLSFNHLVLDPKESNLFHQLVQKICIFIDQEAQNIKEGLFVKVKKQYLRISSFLAKEGGLESIEENEPITPSLPQIKESLQANFEPQQTTTDFQNIDLESTFDIPTFVEV